MPKLNGTLNSVITAYPGPWSASHFRVVNSKVVQMSFSDLIQLGVIRDLLDRAGFRPVDRHEIVRFLFQSSLSSLRYEALRLYFMILP